MTKRKQATSQLPGDSQIRDGRRGAAPVIFKIVSVSILILFVAMILGKILQSDEAGTTDISSSKEQSGAIDSMVAGFPTFGGNSSVDLSGSQNTSSEFDGSAELPALSDGHPTYP